ncbi:MAG: proline iminopeptidase [Micavibrio aeruginosavorus]|uniref:Proline iminopeptidase n=1 Tax=Micavibrio aeruginosavorus TaxID=349221 RepID=A0A2W5BMS7_9BACT|nr:MAG: proline iminopeptidase [Micavibrio aeruginosavorus]
MKFSTGHIQSGDGSIGFLRFKCEKEEGGVQLVFVNGGPGGTYLDENHGIRDLAKDRDVVLYDQLGSYHSPAAFDISLTPMPRFVAELKDVLDGHKFKKAIILGHSFGGTIAADFALTYPDRVAGLILSSPLLSTPRWIEDANRLLRELPLKEQQVIAARLRGENVDEAEYDAAEKIFYSRHLCRIDPWPERMLEGFSKGNKEIYQAMWGLSEFTCTGTLKDYDCFPRLRELRMPVMLVCGRYDEATPETVGDAAAEITNATFVVMENASHCPLYEERETYLSAISTFAAKVDAIG